MKYAFLIFLAAAQAAWAQPDVTSWDILKLGLGDKNPDRRRQAVTALGSIGLLPAAVKQIESALQDEDPLVRQTAAAQLGVMKSVNSQAALKTALADPSGDVAFTAAKSLWDLGDHSGEAVIEEILTGTHKSSGGLVDGAVRDAKRKLNDKRGLIKIGVKEAAGAILGPFSIGITAYEELSKDSGAPNRALAATLLAQKCDSHNLEILENTLKSEKNNSVKGAVAKSLAACGKKDDIPRLEGYLSSPNDALRFMAAAAIIKLSAL